MEFHLSRAQSPMLLAPPMFSLNFTATARVRGPLTEEGIRSALDRLSTLHPLAAVRAIAGPDGSPRWTTEGVPPIPLRIAERTGEEDWVHEVVREVPVPTDYRTGPMMRCVWLRGTEVSDLILVSDHVTADGRASLIALRDLLRLIADPSLTLDPIVPASMADLLDPETKARILKMVADAPPPPPMGEFRMPPPSHDPLQVIPMEFTEKETASLVARCKAEETSVTGALCAAFLPLFAAREPSAPVRRAEIPIDMRNRFARPAGDGYDVYISLALIDVDCAPMRGFWEIARSAKRALEAVPADDLLRAPTIVLHVADSFPFPEAFHVKYDISISNLGRVDLPKAYGPLRLESIYAPTFNGSQPGHRILGVTTFAGRMRCTFTSCDPEAPGLAREARKRLAAAVGASQSS
jgi:hypothetical protein